MVTSRENKHTVGFFGEINPLSNFHPSSFTHEGVHYISSEQLIQANKAKFFGNLETYNQILCCSTSLECKNLSKLIRNVDESKWEEDARNICFPGIHAKFYQNPVAMDTVLYKTGNKKIVECASDHLWGNGMPLSDPGCLDSTKWISQGILGQILECIHSKVTQPRAQSYHQLPPSFTPILAFKQCASLSTSESSHSIGTTSSSEPMPIPPSTNMAIAADIENTSASTIPISDTTASDTDQSGPHHHAIDQEAQMEDTSAINSV